MRTMFTDAGAYVVELEPLEPWRYGFNYNSPRRLKLYQEGKFYPRQTVVLWPRDAFVEWAASHPELGPEEEPAPALPRRKGLHVHLSAPRPLRQAKRNSPLTLWNGWAVYHRWGRLKYAIASLLLPAMVIALIAAVTFRWWVAAPAFLIALFIAHAFQYFFSQ